MSWVRSAKLFTAAEIAAKLASNADLRALRAALRVQIATEMGKLEAAFSCEVIAEANRRLKAAT